MVEYLNEYTHLIFLSINTPRPFSRYCRVNRPSETSSAKRAPELHNRSNSSPRELPAGFSGELKKMSYLRH
jgi:hypothetical protein